MPIRTVNIGLEQAGAAFGAAWTEATLGTDLTVQSGAIIGLMFSLQITSGGTGAPFGFNANGFGLDIPIWSQSGTVTLSNTGTFGGNLTAYLVPAPNPVVPLFSASNLPVTSGTKLFGPGVLGIGPSSLDVTFTTAGNTAIREQLSSKTKWNGRLPIAVDFQVSFATTISTVIQMTGAQLVAFFGGFTGGPYGGKVRYSRDSRFGIPALSTDLVQDHYNPGLYVRPSDADPEDPDATYRPRPGEGSVDDDLPE